MIIIGADYHPGFQQIAFVDTDTGELQERRLEHREDAEKFYRDLAAQELKVRVGMEASGHARWFERLLGELQFELWIGDAAEIRTKRVRKQKTDRQDAQLILQLLIENRFPRIWVPSWENRDLRQLLWHRHRMVQARTRIEPTAGRSAQRRTALQKEAVAGCGTRATGVVSLNAMGEPATARSAGVAGPTDADDCRVDPGHRAGGGEVCGGATLADPSGSWGTDRAGLRADHRQSGSVWVWQADRQLPGAGAIRRVEWESAALGTHHETRERAAAFSARRSGPGHGAQRSGMAQPIFSPGAAARAEDRQGRYGTTAGGSPVLDVAQGMGLRAVEKFRFARGRARTSRWCAVEHRVIDWVSRSPSGEFEVVIMIERVTEETHGSD
jgi:hypothetical protein